jgi:hypothetical protein
MMPRPKTKDELINLSRENFEKLFALVDSFTDEQQRAIYIFDNDRDKNIRDILAHLHHWHLMMLEWYEVGMSGKKPDIPAKGYTFRDTKKLNAEIWKMYQETDYETTRELLKSSFEKLQEIIKNHSDEELFEKKRFKWTGTTSMGSYLVSATSSHYDWAMKHLRKFERSLKV